MLVAVITDSHFGSRGDAPVFYNISEKFFSKVFFPELESRGIKTVVHLGDLYDRRKYINFKTASVCHDQFLKPMEDAGIEFHILRGNHDQYNKNSYNINAIDALVKNKFNNFNIYDEPTEVEFDGTKILFVPWICDQNQENTIKLLKNTTAQICFGHLELAGFEVFRGILMEHGTDHKLFQKFEIVASGHYHHKSTKQNVHYLGACFEFVWSDWNDPRGFHIFDTDTRQFEFIQNPHKLFKMISYDDVSGREALLKINFEDYRDSYVKVVCINKTNLYEFDQFMDNLYKCSPVDISIVEDASNFTDNDDDVSVNEAEDTLTILSTYVDGLSLSVDPTKMKTMMKTIYNEAINIDMEN